MDCMASSCIFGGEDVNLARSRNALATYLAIDLFGITLDRIENEG